MIKAHLKIVVYLTSLFVLTQCTNVAERGNAGDYKESSSIAQLKCTTSLSDNMPRSSTYLLNKPSKSIGQESLDCKAIKKLKVGNGESVRVVIKPIDPVIFKGVEVCGRAVWTPPKPSGELVTLYEDLNNRTFPTRVMVVVDALHKASCFNYVFPELQAKNDRQPMFYIGDKSINFFNLNGGYQISSDIGEVQVVPIAVRKTERGLKEIVCAQFSDPVAPNQNWPEEQLYLACIYNYINMAV